MSPRWRKILLFILLPALAGMAAVWLVIPDSAGFGNLAVWDAFISVTVFTLEALALGNILRFYRPSGGREWTLAIWIIVFCAGWLFITLAIMNFIAGSQEAYSDLIFNSIYLRFFIAIIVLTCLALVTWVRRQSESETRSQQRMSEMQQMSREAELHTLRQQLQPHFLFNSLNSIQALVSSDPLKAKNMVIQLSDYLRGTLRKSNHSRHTVAEELENARLYLEIEKVRFGDRLQVNWQVNEDCPDSVIPTLILQPLLENAIKYGVYQTTGPVAIDMSVRCDPVNIIFEVANPCDPEMAKTTKGTGFGLSSLRRRLFLLYGRNDLLDTMEVNGKFIVLLRIPKS